MVLRLFCFCFVFVFFAFIKAAVIRSIVLRYACAPIAARASSFFPFLHVSLFRMVFFYLVTTVWVFDINFNLYKKK